MDYKRFLCFCFLSLLISLITLSACSAPNLLEAISEETTNENLEAGWASDPASSPIVLMTIENIYIQNTVKFTCMNTTQCYPDLKNVFIISTNDCLIDSLGNLYLPLVTPGDAPANVNSGSLLFVSVKKQTPQWLSFVTDETKPPRLEPVLSQEGEITFLGDNRVLYVVKEGALLRTIRLPEVPSTGQGIPNLAIHESISFDLILPAQNLPYDGDNYGLVYLINTKEGKVYPRLVPLPQFIPIPDSGDLKSNQRYSLTIDSTSADLQTAFVSFYLKDSVENSLAEFIAGYDWSTNNLTKEISWRSDSYHKYHDFYYRSSFDSMDYATPPDILPPMIVNTINWEPLEIINEIWAERPEGQSGTQLHISPSGNNFLVGTREKLYLVSPESGILKQYLLPEDLKYREYYLMSFWN